VYLEETNQPINVKISEDFTKTIFTSGRETYILSLENGLYT
jgi:hypothetical protein